MRYALMSDIHEDCDWRAGYVLLDIGDGDPRVEFVRVEYDIDRAVAAIRSSELPDDFAEYLRTGGMPATVGAETHSYLG